MASRRLAVEKTMRFLLLVFEAGTAGGVRADLGFGRLGAGGGCAQPGQFPVTSDPSTRAVGGQSTRASKDAAAELFSRPRWQPMGTVRTVLGRCGGGGRRHH